MFFFSQTKTSPAKKIMKRTKITVLLSYKLRVRRKTKKIVVAKVIIVPAPPFLPLLRQIQIIIIIPIIAKNQNLNRIIVTLFHLYVQIVENYLES